MIRQQTRGFFLALDQERISTYQTMYYLLIITAGLYLALVASAPPQLIEVTLGPINYLGFLALNIVCPLMTLIGRRIVTLAARRPLGGSNGAFGGAWLQLAGDSGVWGAIIVYIACVINTSVWGQGLYGAFFVLMGVPGGFMFTLRSVRRLMQIRAAE
jgi:hypothetical protein